MIAESHHIAASLLLSSGKLTLTLLVQCDRGIVYVTTEDDYKAVKDVVLMKIKFVFSFNDNKLFKL